MTPSLQRRACLVALVGLGTALAAAAPPAAAQTLEELKKKGEIHIGLLVDFPPYGTATARGQPDGYDADVARLLARDMGLKLNLVPVTGPNRIPFLLARKVDLLVASLPVTPERARQVAFTRPYSVAAILLYGSVKAGISSTADLKNHRIGVVRGSAPDVAVTSSAPRGTAIHRFDDEASMMQALISGQVDAIGCSPPLAAQIAQRVPSGTFEDKFVLRRQEMAMAVRKGQDELLKTANEFIAGNTANGELNRLYRKWLARDLLLPG